ncbi:TetR/AcrR family transcriptional regulator [Ascidiimonas aurantiaca]|uniref:TetR/AcrR family transcriptional regulator n=1 Tax=Ascidiimonas aurantiaca TaxID=1685432 RepID=UPI0030EB90C6
MKITTSPTDTEEKIKQAAHKLFQQKGFAATKTRDIAEEAGINVALLNYYFRSKQRLFELVMLKTINDFFSGLDTLLNTTETSLEEKLQLFVDHYIDFLLDNPDVPTFIIMELRAHPEKYAKQLGIAHRIRHSVFIKQFQEAFAEQRTDLNPVHILMNLSALVAFPFVSAPLLKTAMPMDDTQFRQYMQERKKLIPNWILNMLQS